MSTKVIFRREQSGNVIALFPELPHGPKPSECCAFNGTDWYPANYTRTMRRTRVAKGHEYRDLMHHIQEYYSELAITQHATELMTELRVERCRHFKPAQVELPPNE